jgi:cysteine-rich repeat protein
MIRLWMVVAWLSATGCWAGNDDGGSATVEGCGDGVVDILKEGCDDGNNDSGDGCSASCSTETTITTHWKLEDHAGVPQPCPAGFDLAELRVAHARSGEQAFPFPCEAGQGTVQVLGAARDAVGAVRVLVKSSATQEVFGETWYATVPSGGGVADVTVTMITDVGRLHLFWGLSRAGAPTTCTALGVANVQIDAIPAVGPTISLVGACSPSDYPTGNLPSGTYRIVLSASSASGPGSGTLDGVVVPTGGQLANVAPIDVAF